MKIMAKIFPINYSYRFLLTLNNTSDLHHEINGVNSIFSSIVNLPHQYLSPICAVLSSLVAACCPSHVAVRTMKHKLNGPHRSNSPVPLVMSPTTE